MSHKEWLSGFDDTVKQAGDELHQKQISTDQRNSQFRVSMGRMRREVLRMWQKPIWAMTEEELNEKEEMELIEFGTSLSYENTMAELMEHEEVDEQQVTPLVVGPPEKTLANVSERSTPCYDPKYTSHNPFTCTIPSPPNLSRNLVLSTESCRIPFDASRLPYLRHCPFV